MAKKVRVKHDAFHTDTQSAPPSAPSLQYQPPPSPEELLPYEDDNLEEEGYY